MVRTSEELIADRRWRRRHSAYLLWAIPALGFVPILYTGIRARRRHWTIWGVFYGLVVIGVSAMIPDDSDRPVISLDLVFLAAWIGSAAQLLATRQGWLEWKADHQGVIPRGPSPGYPAPPPAASGTAAPAVTAASPATPVGWNDPTSAQDGSGNVPVGGVPMTAGPVSQPAPSRRRPRRLILILIGASVVVLVAGGLIAVVTDVVFTNDLLEAEFRNGSKPLLTGESPDYVIDLVDGTYRIRSRAGAQQGASGLRPIPPEGVPRGYVGRGRLRVAHQRLRRGVLARSGG